MNGSEQVKVAKKESKWFYDDLSADYKSGLEQWREIEYQDWKYGFELLPPMDWHEPGTFMIGEPDAHTEDDVVHAGFTAVESRYFARLIGRKRFKEEGEKLRAAVRRGEV